MKIYTDREELEADIETVEYQLRDWIKFNNRHWYGNCHAKDYIILLRRLRKQLKDMK